MRPEEPIPHWLEYPWVNLSHVCRLLWGSSASHLTSRMARRRKAHTWTAEECIRLEEIRASFEAQLSANKLESHL